MEGEVNRQTVMNKTWKKWTDADLNILYRLVREGVSTRVIAERLGRTTNSIQIQASARGVKLNGADLWWRDDEVEKLRVAEGVLTISEVARELNKSYTSVHCKARALSIDLKSGRKDIWSNAELEALRAAKGILTVSEVAERLERTIPAITHKAISLGIKLRDGRRNK